VKHSWKAPPFLQELSYRILPGRRRVVRLLNELDQRAQSLEETQRYLSEKLVSGEPFLLGRPGGTESEGVAFFIKRRLNSRSISPKPYSKWFRKYSQIQPGITHHSDEDLDYFCSTYLEATLGSDLLAYGLFAPGALGQIRRASAIGAPICHHENLEPWVALTAGVRPWSLSLEGKKVLVVHPFSQSIAEQFAKRKQITGVKDFLPDFSLDILTPPVTFAGETSNRVWSEHLNDLIEDAQGREFDVALIGAGGYGLPLGHAIKQMGRQAVHLGGITQLLFGIRGKRWDSNRHLSPYLDHTWARPKDSEKPKSPESVESGAYW